MCTRTIMIFPEFAEMEIIDEIRERYDPLAHLVRPHITIVFPFENQMSNNDIAEILSVRLKNIHPFELVLNGISKQEDRFGNYLFLNVVNGTEIITHLHDLLYSNEFSEFDLGMQYVPHMTVGKLKTTEELNEAYDSVKENKTLFRSMITKISVEMIGKNEESIIVIEKELN